MLEPTHNGEMRGKTLTSGMSPGRLASSARRSDDDG
jgi:hypothetical protein